MRHGRSITTLPAMLADVGGIGLAPPYPSDYAEGAELNLHVEAVHLQAQLYVLSPPPVRRGGLGRGGAEPG